MKKILQNVNYFKDGAFKFGNYCLNISEGHPLSPDFDGGIVSKFNNCFVFPAFCDVHVHLREPGFSYKETIQTGSLAAARGGYTHVCAMPNLNPVPDSMEHLQPQLDAIAKDARIRVSPYGALTVEEKGEAIADLAAMAPNVCAFSDDGRGVQSDELMEKAMLKAKQLGKMIVAHCEVNDLLKGGYIHDGEYANMYAEYIMDAIHNYCDEDMSEYFYDDEPVRAKLECMIWTSEIVNKCLYRRSNGIKYRFKCRTKLKLKC